MSSKNEYWIGHCYNKTNVNARTGSDKIYILKLVENAPNDFSVTGYWGKRTKTLACQPKFTGGFYTARCEFNELVQKQETKKGYINIESAQYNDTNIPNEAKATVKKFKSYIEDAVSVVEEAEVVVMKKKYTKKNPIKAAIANSLGIDISEVNEDTWFAVNYIDESNTTTFNIGVSYMAHLDIDRPDMFAVLDNDGEEKTMFSRRFEIVKE